MVLHHTHPTEPLARASKRAAFTLMEVLVVVAILVVLAGVGVPVYFRIQDTANKKAAQTVISNVEKVIEGFRTEHGSYPPDLQTLTNPQPDGGPSYIETKSTYDPWGNQVVYDPNTKHPESHRPLVYSRGPGGNSKVMPVGWPAQQ